MAKLKKTPKSELKTFRDEVIRHFDVKTEETKRHFDVVAESMDEKIDTLIEGHHAHSERFDRLEKKVDDEVGGLRKEMNYKFGVVFDELHLIRSEQVKRDEFILLEKRVLELEKRAVAKK